MFTHKPDSGERKVITGTGECKFGGLVAGGELPLMNWENIKPVLN
jgi:hypothetical protein